MSKNFSDLSVQAVKQKPWDLLVWPETTFPSAWIRFHSSADQTTASDDWRRAHADTEAFAERAGRLYQGPVILGAKSAILHTDRHYEYNSAVVLDAAGREIGRYDKKYRIPFGEYIPLRESVPWMKYLSPYGKDFRGIEIGEGLPVFRIEGARSFTVAVLICYEDTVPHQATTYLRGQGPAPDIFVNISNDGWFKCSEEHEQHLAIARFRAIETRRPLVRAVNIGISAVIDGNGRVIALPAESWGRSKGVEAILVAQVPLDRRFSWYAQNGDVLPWACWLMVLLGMAATPLRGR